MKKLLMFLLFVALALDAAVILHAAPGFRDCQTWDTFCKSPPQIVATKCRLGVPVKNDQCEMLGLRFAWYGYGESMVEGLPVTSIDRGVGTEAILRPYLVAAD